MRRQRSKTPPGRSNAKKAEVAAAKEKDARLRATMSVLQRNESAIVAELAQLAAAEKTLLREQAKIRAALDEQS